MKKLFLVFLTIISLQGLCQTNNCITYSRLPSDSVIRIFQVNLSKDRDPLTKKADSWFLNNYNKYNEPYGAIMNRIVQPPSILVHQYGKDHNIKNSILFDYSNETVSLVSYYQDSVERCFLKNVDMELSRTLLEYDSSFRLPLGYLSEIPTENYLMEIYLNNEPKLIRISVLGLPRENFIGGSGILNSESPWYQIRNIFFSFEKG